MSRSAIVVFARNPVEGQVKTRLAATVGNKRALAVYNQLLVITRDGIMAVNCDKYVFYTGGIPDAAFWDGCTFIKQTGSDLGQKMLHAFTELIDRGYEKVVVIGTDCPGIDTRVLQESFDRLDEADLVIGPAYDGGYYLIGARKPHQLLFQDINWSSSEVLAETLEQADKLSLDCRLLVQLPDIDEEKDLIYLCKKSGSA